MRSSRSVYKYFVSLCLSVVSSYGIYFTTEVFVSSYAEFSRQEHDTEELTRLREINESFDYLVLLYIQKMDLSSKTRATNLKQKERLQKKLNQPGLTDEQRGLLQAELTAVSVVLDK